MQELYNSQILERYRKKFQIDYLEHNLEQQALSYKAYEDMLDRVSGMDDQTQTTFFQAEMEYFIEKRDKVKKEVQNILNKLAEEPDDKKNRTVYIEEMPATQDQQTGDVIERERKIYNHYQLATKCALESYDYTKELILLQKCLKVTKLR